MYHHHSLAPGLVSITPPSSYPRRQGREHIAEYCNQTMEQQVPRLQVVKLEILHTWGLVWNQVSYFAGRQQGLRWGIQNNFTSHHKRWAVLESFLHPMVWKVQLILVRLITPSNPKPALSPGSTQPLSSKHTYQVTCMRETGTAAA